MNEQQEQCIYCEQVATHYVWDKNEVPQPICGNNDCQLKILAASEHMNY